MKKAIAFLVTVIMAVSCMCTSAAAALDIRVAVDGEYVVWTDGEPFVDANSRTLVPLRAIGEAMDLDVDWDQSNQVAVFTRTTAGEAAAELTETLYFKIDSKIASYEIRSGDEISSGEIEMDTAAVAMNGHVYAPVRALAEFFGYTVNWNSGSNTVTIGRTGNYYATIGRWASAGGGLGLTIMKYEPETGSLEFIATVNDEVITGSQCVHPTKNVVYVCDEKESQDGMIGGGGYVMAYAVDPLTGGLTLLNRVVSYGAAPSYAVVDTTGNYLLVVNHGKENHATHVEKQADGSFAVNVVLDDASLVVYKINSDGSIGDVCDISVTTGNGPTATTHVYSHLHSVTQSPSGELFFVCDKGTDEVYTYHLDRESGTLELLQEYQCVAGSVPRYSAFHPTLPYVFQNEENRAEVNSWKYDEETGALELVCSVQMFSEAELAEMADLGFKEGGFVSFGPSDIIVSADGLHLYCSVRKANKLVVMDIADDGTLTVSQVVDSNGNNPRGLCLSPDGRFLFCVNMNEDCIVRFLVNDNGTLTYDAVVAEGLNLPANMIIAEY